MWPLLQIWRPCWGRDDFRFSILISSERDRTYQMLSRYLARTKSKSEAKNWNNPSHGRKIWNGGHIHSNYTMLLNCCTHKYFTLTELPRSIYIFIHIYMYIHIHQYISIRMYIYIYTEIFIRTHMPKYVSKYVYV